MNLFELFVKVGVDDQASNNLKSITSKLGNGLKTAAKIGTTAVAGAAAGITALTGAAVKNYAEYEQLVGGVQTLFGLQGQSLQEYAKTVGKTTEKALDDWLKYTTGERKVLNNAEIAYKTAGMSMNAYMETVTSFSASLIQSLGGDTSKAADYADQAIIDMSDNANKMGTSMELIQNAYQGFAKGNYTMLDNLKLGYGGTATEMARLINDSGVLGDKLIDLTDTKNIGFKLQELGFAKITEAIHAMQVQMGIAGTTQKEASETISGSLNSMKSAWSNLITGLADDNADFDTLIENMVSTVETFAGNIVPRIEIALGGIADLISKLAPIIIEKLPSLVEQIVPSLITAATNMVNSVVKVLPNLLNTVVDAIIDNAPMLIESALALVYELVNGVLKQLPQIVKLGLDLIVSLANGIAESLPKLIPTIIDVILQIVETITNQENLTALLGAALTITKELAWGITDNIDKIIDAIFLLIDGIIDFLVKPENLMMLIETAIQLVMAIATGIVKAIPRVITAVLSLIGSIFTNFATADWGKIGNDLVDGLKNGISRAWTNLKNWFKNLFGDLIGIAKKILDIKSPSRVFRDQIGKQMAAGLGLGWEDEFGKVKSDIENSLDFDNASVGINASIRKVGAGAAGGAFGGTSIGVVNINIDGYNAQDDDELAETIAEKLYTMTERKGAVFA